MNIDLHMVAKVAEGYEYFYSILDDDGKVLVGNQFYFIGKEQPDKTAITSWKTAWLERFTTELKEAANEPTHEVMEKTKVEELLRQKGYLEEKEKLEDLKDASTLIVAYKESK